MKFCKISLVYDYITQNDDNSLWVIDLTLPISKAELPYLVKYFLSKVTDKTNKSIFFSSLWIDVDIPRFSSYINTWLSNLPNYIAEKKYFMTRNNIFLPFDSFKIIDSVEKDILKIDTNEEGKCVIEKIFDELGS